MARRISKPLEDIKTTFETLTDQIGKLRTQIVKQQKEIRELKKTKKELEKKIQEQQEREEQLLEENKKASEIMEENQRLKAELDEINKQLSKISSMYQEISKKKEDVKNVRKLLSIYITLLENVFYGKPHARVLWMLHGDVKEMKRSQIVEASAFQPAVVKKAIFDLANAGLVEYNVEKDTVKLKHKIF